MFTFEMRVGRLFENRTGELNDDDMAAFAKTGRDLMSKAPGGVIVCADCRRVQFLRAEFVPQFVAYLNNVNAKIERAAVWIDPKNRIFNLQMIRMTREANNPARRVFEDANEMAQYLGEVLTREESERLRQFIDEPVPEGI